MQILQKHWRTGGRPGRKIQLLHYLPDKGFLKTAKIGRRNEYIAIVSESSYQTAQAETFLEKIYEGNAKGLVSTLIEKDLLSAEDMEDLRRYWEGGESGK